VLSGDLEKRLGPTTSIGLPIAAATMSELR
jgi:hypothetical protein